jgi:type IV pilus assembly protein PilM
VRAVRLDGVNNEGMAQIAKHAFVRLGLGRVQSGRILQPQAVAAAVAEAVKAVGPAREIIIGLGTADAAVRRVSLPSAVRPDERLAAIRSNGEDLSASVRLRDAVIDINHIRDETAGDGTTSSLLLLAGVSRESVDTLLRVCRFANITPRAFDLSGAATARALTRDIPESRKAAVIVDVGATTTTVIVREGLTLRSLRVLSQGGFDITSQLAAASKRPLQEAESMKWNMRLPTSTAAAPTARVYAGLDDDDDEYQARVAQQNTAEQALANAVDGLVETIAAAVESDTDGLTAPTVLLTGSGSLLNGFRERLRRRLGAQVLIASPWATLPAPRRGDEPLNPALSEQTLTPLVTAIGLALWEPAG